MLFDIIQTKQAKVCIVGLGYVGLPLALQCVKAGFFVYGYDIDSAKIEMLQAGRSYIKDVSNADVIRAGANIIFTDKSSAISLSDIIIICVPTPLKNRKPNLDPLFSAIEVIRNNVEYNQDRLIILESTVAAGTTNFIGRAFPDKNHFVAFSPERVNPGEPMNLIPKIVGGVDDESGNLAYEFYCGLLGQDNVYLVKDSATAEMVKLLENSFRLVNISFINEFARACELIGVSVWDVIEAAKTKPFGFMPFYPGPGVGGHCIPVDPIYLIENIKGYGLNMELLTTAHLLNYEAKFHVAHQLNKAIGLGGKKILIVGVTYKPNVPDCRESPAKAIMEHMREYEATIIWHDPLIKGGVDLTPKVLDDVDAVVILQDHDYVNYSLIANHAKFIFDCRNCMADYGLDGDRLMVLGYG